MAHGPYGACAFCLVRFRTWSKGRQSNAHTPCKPYASVYVSSSHAFCCFACPRDPFGRRASLKADESKVAFLMKWAMKRFQVLLRSVLEKKKVHLQLRRVLAERREASSRACFWNGVFPRAWTSCGPISCAFFCLNAFSCHAFHWYWGQGRALSGVRAVCTWDKRQHSWRHRKPHMPLHLARLAPLRWLVGNCPPPCLSGPPHIPSRKTKAGRATRPCMRNRRLRRIGDPNACRLCTMAGTHLLIRCGLGSAQKHCNALFRTAIYPGISPTLPRRALLIWR